MRIPWLSLATGYCLLSACSPASHAVDFSTLDGKVLFGYQGWFGCPGPWGGDWRHWSRGAPTASNVTVEMWPDLSEFPQADLCAAGTLTVGGNAAYLYSARNGNIADRHFEWMRDYGLDGVLIQRFLTEIPGNRSGGDVVLKHIAAAAEKYGRAMAVEYDVSGADSGTWDATLKADWQYLVDQVGIISRPNYLQQGGKPLVSIWGMGLNDAGHPPADPRRARALIDWFHAGAAPGYRAAVMGGVPAGFRTLNRDARADSLWLGVYRALDAVQPWNVGRTRNLADVDGWWKQSVLADRDWLDKAGVLYMPVVFPGFSWSNWNGGNPNDIPRLGGRFLWRQANVARKAGLGALKIAMFDELDESTAMFKLAPTRQQAPDQAWWLTLDADGEFLPSDWYLRLASCLTAELRGKRALTDSIPLRPGAAWRDSASCWDSPGRAVPGTGGGPRVIRVAGGWRIQGLTGARLRIRNLRGREIKSLPVRGGEAFWDGLDAGGVKVNGVCLVVWGEGRRIEMGSNFAFIPSP